MLEFKFYFGNEESYLILWKNDKERVVKFLKEFKGRSWIGFIE